MVLLKSLVLSQPLQIEFTSKSCKSYLLLHHHVCLFVFVLLPLANVFVKPKNLLIQETLDYFFLYLYWSSSWRTVTLHLLVTLEKFFQLTMVGVLPAHRILFTVLTIIYCTIRTVLTAFYLLFVNTKPVSEWEIAVSAISASIWCFS